MDKKDEGLLGRVLQILERIVTAIKDQRFLFLAVIAICILVVGFGLQESGSRRESLIALITLAVLAVFADLRQKRFEAEIADLKQQLLDKDREVEAFKEDTRQRVERELVKKKHNRHAQENQDN